MGLVKPIGSLDRGLSKDELIALAESNAHEVIESGQYDLLKVYVEMKRYELYFKTVMDKVREAALVVAQETGMKSFDYAGAKVSNTQRSVFNFDNDPTWQKLHDESQHLKERIKQHEALLKQVRGEKEEYLNEETGELIEIYAPTEQIVESIMVKL
ncbi:MAG: hypothetical protein KF734_02310 [Saprospiraceae bacterium]|nr:hypothetical protein [Saprospiraceae bacterium]